MASPEGPSALRPAPLLWLYVLIAVALVSVAAAAGRLFFDGLPALAVPWGIRFARCEAMYERGVGSTARADFDTCMGDQDQLRGLVMLAAIGVVLAGALVLAFAIPLRDRRLLRRYGRRDEPAAQSRFVELCRSHGLTGRRAPRLWVAGPAVRHAFTTAVPGGRPTVVLPARVALRTNEEFDAIVSHELAHVLARDVTWVSVVRGPQWLFIPVAAAASLPLFDREGVSLAPATTLIEAFLLVVAVAILAAALLRMREHEADSYAANTGAEVGLVDLLGRAPAPTRRSGPLALVRRLVSRHPDPAQRVAALRQTGRAFEGGFAQALAVGFVAMMAMGIATTLLSTLSRAWRDWQGHVTATAVGVAVLSVLFPSLFRRARVRGDHPQWWRAVLGVAAGVVLGAFVSPVVSVTGQIPYPYLSDELAGDNLSWLRFAGVGAVAVIAAGVVAITISLAVLSAGTGGKVFARLAMASASLTALAALWPVVTLFALLQSTVDVRAWVAYLLVRNVWPALGVTTLIMYALLLAVARSDRGGRTPWLVAAIATVIASGAAIRSSSLAAATEMNDRLREQQERWWICAAAGLVVLLVVALGQSGRYGWPIAVLTATATTAVSTTAHYLYAYLADRPAEPAASWVDPAVALVWLFYVMVLLAPLLAARGDSRPAVPSRTLRTVPALAGTVVVTALVAVAVLSFGVPGGYATDSIYKASAPTDPYASARHAIRQDQAELIAVAGALVVPDSWTIVDSGPVGAGILASNANIDNPLCQPLIREGFLSAGRPGPKATGEAEFSSKTSGDLRSTVLTVTVYSYDAPVSDTVIRAAEDARLACPTFRVLGNQVSIDFRIDSGPAPNVGERSWRYNSSLNSLVSGRLVTGTSAYVIVAAGNTMIVVYMSAVEEPLNEQLLRRTLDNAMYTLLHLR